MGNGYADYGTKHPANAERKRLQGGQQPDGNRAPYDKAMRRLEKLFGGLYANHSSIGSYWYNNTAYEQRRGVQYVGEFVEFRRNTYGRRHSYGRQRSCHEE